VAARFGCQDSGHARRAGYGDAAAGEGRRDDADREQLSAVRGAADAGRPAGLSRGQLEDAGRLTGEHHRVRFCRVTGHDARVDSGYDTARFRFTSLHGLLIAARPCRTRRAITKQQAAQPDRVAAPVRSRCRAAGNGPVSPGCFAQGRVLGCRDAGASGGRAGCAAASVAATGLSLRSPPGGQRSFPAAGPLAAPA